jgi:hypothetical protein
MSHTVLAIGSVQATPGPVVWMPPRGSLAGRGRNPGAMSATGPRAIRVLLAGLLLGGAVAGCGLSGHPLPSHGEPRVGAAYRVIFYCKGSLSMGDTWWDFDPFPTTPFPHERDNPTTGRPEVPGVVKLTSSTTAVFVADVDQSELRMIKSPTGPLHPQECL